MRSSRDRSTERTKGRERESGRTREREGDDRRASRRDGRSDRDLRDSGRSEREREPRRERAPAKPKTPTPERELRELHREACTVMAFGLSMQAEEWDVFEFFSTAGELVDVRLIKDKNTGRSKGIAYIEFKNRADVMNALQLNGRQLKGVAVLVKSSEAEKNFAWEAQQLQV